MILNLIIRKGSKAKIHGHNECKKNVSRILQRYSSFIHDCHDWSFLLPASTACSHLFICRYLKTNVKKIRVVIAGFDPEALYSQQMSRILDLVDKLYQLP